MPTYAFTLILSGPEATEDLASALHGGGCDDALLGSSCGVVTLDFTREAPSRRDAIVSAIRDVRRATPGRKVIGVQHARTLSPETYPWIDLVRENNPEANPDRGATP
jgi:hypothetical protein